MMLSVYEALVAVHANHDPIQPSLTRWSRTSGFDPIEIARLREMAAEAQAVTNSYLAGLIEITATEQAGRLFQARIRRERRQE